MAVRTSTVVFWILMLQGLEGGCQRFEEYGEAIRCPETSVTTYKSIRRCKLENNRDNQDKLDWK